VRSRIATAVATAAIVLTSTAFVTSRASAATPYDGVVREDTWITTRYGERLQTQIAYPANGGVKAPGQFPVILVYTFNCPGGWAENFVPYGYISATVGMPGLCGSEGRFEAFSDKVALSGYDVVEWLAAQPWSTGKVGMIGESGRGVVQWMVAQTRPPHLTTIVPQEAAIDVYEDAIYRGGMLHTTGAGVVIGILYSLYWGEGVASRASDPEMLRTSAENGWIVPSDDFAEMVAEHPQKDDFWQRYVCRCADITIPVWAQGNWDDFFVRGMTNLYSFAPNPNNRLTMGQNGHAPPGPNLDAVTNTLPWFDHWLKGIDSSGYDAIASNRFQYYLQEGNVWKTTTTYPIPGTAFTTFYLGPNSTLTATAPDASGSDTYLYDPTAGRHNGQNIILPLLRPNTPSSQTLVGYNDPGHSGDQRLEADSLTYIADPLLNDMEVTGPLSATLYASSSAEDTDWVVKLIDVFPDTVGTSGPQPGYRNLVTIGRLKGTHRNGHVKVERIPQGETIKYNIEVMPTSYLFRAGHRLEIQIASADASASLPNPNPAVNTIFHSSSITVPFAPA
jgi:hypothetical protein